MLKIRHAYIIALTIIALTISISQYFSQRFILDTKVDSRVINISGRQRMLSQKICKSALELVNTDDSLAFEKSRNELSDAVELWSKSHLALQHGDKELGINSINNSKKILALFDKLDQPYRKISEASSYITKNIKFQNREQTQWQDYLHEVLNYEDSFLTTMDKITFQYDKEASEKMNGLSVLEYILYAFAILLLLLEAFFIFRPAIKKLGRNTQKLIEKEKLLEKARIEKKYLEILDSMIEGFQVIDDKFRYVYLNKAAEQQSNMPSGSLIGRKMEECYPGIEKTSLYSFIKDTLEHQNHHEIDNEFTYPNGKKAWFRLSIQPTSEGLLIVSSDISELVKKQKELEQFSYITSHDLQEPLNSIVAFSKLLQHSKEKLDESDQKIIEYIAELADRMKSFITSLLEYSQIGRQTEIKNVNIKQLVENLRLNLHSLIEKEEASINFIGKDLTIHGFEEDLTKLFQNLIINAIKYKKKDEKPIVIIDAQEHEKEYLFSVKDNGIGIEEEYFEKIFEIFQRLHTRDKYGGTGIGLSYCKKIVELHDGKIWLNSEVDKGTTFYFTIPKIN